MLYIIVFNSLFTKNIKIYKIRPICIIHFSYMYGLFCICIKSKIAYFIVPIFIITGATFNKYIKVIITLFSYFVKSTF